MQIQSYPEVQRQIEAIRTKVEPINASDHQDQSTAEGNRDPADKVREARIGAALYRYEQSLADMTVKALAETLGLSDEGDDLIDPMANQDRMALSLYAQPLLNRSTGTGGRGYSLNETI